MKRFLFATFVCLTLTARLAVLADYPSTVLSQGPIGYWRLNETTAPPAPELTATNIGSVGAAGDGVYTNGVVKGGGGALPGEPANRGTAFNRRVNVANRVRVPYSPEWNVAGPFTVEFWAKPGQTEGIACPAASLTLTTNYVLSGWTFAQGEQTLGSGNGWTFTLCRAENTLATRIASVAMSLNTNSWYHIVGSYDGTNVDLYVNGVLADRKPLNDVYRPVFDTTAPMTFGSRSDNSTVDIGSGWLGYIGRLDEPAFYTNALSPVRILAHYLAGTNGTPSTPYSTVVLADAPAGYWRLNEPADVIPTATNSGTLGAAGDGGYIYNANTGQNGPATPDYAGFGAINPGVGLDGSSGYVSLPGLNLNTNTITITAWLKRNGEQPQNTAIVFNHTADTVGGLKFDQNPALQELSYNWGNSEDTSSFRSSIFVPDDQWVFVALVVHPDFAVLALHDGANFSSVTNFVTHAPLPFNWETRIGSDARKPATGFTGTIDEVAIFNRSLSVGEVYSQYGGAVGDLAPLIFTGPQAEPIEPVVGDPLVLSVDAGGTPPLSYQWRRDGTNIIGATGPVYSISVASDSDAGDYEVVVTNLFGSVTGQLLFPVTLTPQSAPVVTQDPLSRTLFPGGVASFKASASGGQLAYQWRKGISDIAGANQSSYTIGSVTPADNGIYSVRITNILGAVTSAPAVLTVTVPAPATYEGLVSADGPESWWRLNEAPGDTNMFDSFGRHDGLYTGGTLGTPGAILGGDTAVTFGGSDLGRVPYSSALNRENFTLEVWARMPAGMLGLDGGVVSSFSSVGQAEGRGIACVKSKGDFWTGRNGKGNSQWYYYNDLGPFVPDQWTHWAVTVSGGSVVWYLNGEYRFGPYADACAKNLSAPFYVGAFQPDGAEPAYMTGDVDEVVYYGKALTREQIQAHYLAALYGTNSKPSFLQQPVSRTLIEGDTAVFRAVTSGNPPILFQWYRDGSLLPGQTNSTLKVTNVWYSDQGEYWMAASNSGGTTNSAHATLTVMPPAAFVCVTNGLVLHLKFEDNLLDSSPRTNDGTAVGDISFVSGELGRALHYNTDVGAGAYNYVTLGVPDDLQFSSNVNFSVSYWVRTPPGAYTGDLPFLSTSINSFGLPGYTFAPSYQGGSWSWSLNGVGIYGGSLINDGEWHHVVHTFVRGGVGTTWLDGKFADERSAGGFNELDTGLPTNIGQGALGDYPESGEADIDDIGIWRVALSPYEAPSIFYAARDYGRTFNVVGPFRLRIRRSGTQIELIWQTGTLYQADQAGGPWTPVPGAVAPYHKFTPGPSNKFYRVF